MPLASSGRHHRLAAGRHTARLEDPGDDDDAFLGHHLRQELADLGVLPLAADFVGRDERGQEADVGFGHFAAGVRQRKQRQVERTAAQRGKLRVDLHQRRIGIDVELERAVGSLFDFGGEPAAEAIAEVPLIDRPAGELVRNLERGRLRMGAGPLERQGGGGERAGDQPAAIGVHVSSRVQSCRACPVRRQACRHLSSWSAYTVTITDREIKLRAVAVTRARCVRGPCARRTQSARRGRPAGCGRRRCTRQASPVPPAARSSR